MDKLRIALKKLQAVVLEPSVASVDVSAQNHALVLTLNANLMRLGYILEPELFNALSRLSREEVIGLAQKIVALLTEFKGAQVKHKPMYPNFPAQVMDATHTELFFNAILHYFSIGQWLPNFEELPRQFAFEQTKFQPIGLASEATFCHIFTRLLQSNDSLSAEDKAIVTWFLQHTDGKGLVIPERIPFHENACLVAAHYLQQGQDISAFVHNATDILRLATFLSDGDVSLADNTRFRSQPRVVRRQLMQQLERVINEEDIGRHRNKWVRLFHNLHVGDYSGKVFTIAGKARNGKHLKSFYSDLEAALISFDLEAAVRLLRSRPGEFGRRLDHVLRVAQDKDFQVHAENHRLYNLPHEQMRKYEQRKVVNGFLAVVEEIPTRNLTQLLGHLQTRHALVEQRVVFPKGSYQQAVVVTQPLDEMDAGLLAELQAGIRASLQRRFASLTTLGKVWLDPALRECPLPTQQRSSSAGLFSVARGTRLPLEVGQDTLRLFIYWVGLDIDLSATFHDESGTLVEHVSYTHLRSGAYQAYHSGDITRAPNGASEFIDIHIPSAAQQARYLAMNVLVFNGPTFAEHETCFVGWMMREHPKSNALYKPDTVQQKLDLRQPCRNVMPVVFDLVERKAIWTDLPTSRDGYYYNNVESNQATIQQKLNAIVNVRNRLSLYDLFSLHALARGEIVVDKAEADTVFAVHEGITPFHVNEINAAFLL